MKELTDTCSPKADPTQVGRIRRRGRSAAAISLAMASDGEADDAKTLLHRSTRRSIRQEPASVFAPFQKLSEDLGLTTCVDRSAKGVSAINNATAMLSDRQMVRTYKSLLGTVGNSARKMVVDPQMPHWLNNSVGSTFDSIWPEIEKEMCDRFILQNGFSFGDYRRKFAAHEAEVPKTCWSATVGTLLHATQAYDMSFFGRLRKPLYFLIFCISLFPLYGVDSLFVIILWLCTNRYDENQLVAFVIRSKGLQFITTGLLSGVYAFAKLYLCVTTGDTMENNSCAAGKNPGGHSSFLFEVILIVVRTVLVWITFILIRNFEALTAWKKKNDALHARLATKPRHGLLPPWTTCILLAGTCLGAAYTIMQYAGVAAEANKQYAGYAAQAPQVIIGGLPAVIACTLLLVQLPLTYLLTRPVHSPGVPLFFTLLAISVAVFYGYQQNTAEVGLAATTHAIVSSVALAALYISNLAGSREDDAHRKKIEGLMQELDRDGDGQVTKAEFRVLFQSQFPNDLFEPVWREIDKDGDGSLSMAELADHFGMSHLVKEVSHVSSDQLSDMASIEQKLSYLTTETALAQQAGGIITSFFMYDVVSFCVICGLVAYHMEDFGYDVSDWRVLTSLYFAKVMVGLSAMPFLLFNVPMLKDALVHVRKTGYDRAGKVVALLSSREIKTRFEADEKNRLKRRWLVKNGYELPDMTLSEQIEDVWNDWYDGSPITDRKKLTKGEERALAKAYTLRPDVVKADAEVSRRQSTIPSYMNDLDNPTNGQKGTELV